MNMNLNNLFDDLSVQNADKIKADLTSSLDNETKERIKTTVISKIGSEKKTHRKRFNRFIAFAAAAAILVGSVSAGATAYFKPDSDFAQYITFNDKVDMSTLGIDVNQTVSSNGYDVTLKQVLTDNSIFNCIFEIPEKGAYQLVPTDGFKVKVNGKERQEVTVRVSTDEESHPNLCNVFIYDLENIKSGDKITFDIESLEYLGEEFEERYEKGNWSFEFEAQRSNVTKKLDTIDMLELSDNDKYKIKRAVVSPIGLSIRLSGGRSGMDNALISGQQNATLNSTPFISIEMKDGTIYTDVSDENGKEDINTSAGARTELGKATVTHIRCTFNTVINIDDIKSITIGGVEIYTA